MSKRSGHKRSGHKRTAKKERKDKRKTYRKGSKSKTMKGKKDFTTKKSSKVFNRRKHYQKHAKGSRFIRRPYAKKGGKPPLQPAGFRRAAIPRSDSTNPGMNKQMQSHGGVTMGPDGMPEIIGHTGSSQGRSSASTQPQRAHTSSNTSASEPWLWPLKDGGWQVVGSGDDPHTLSGN